MNIGLPKDLKEGMTDTSDVAEMLFPESFFIDPNMTFKTAPHAVKFLINRYNLLVAKLDDLLKDLK